LFMEVVNDNKKSKPVTIICIQEYFKDSNSSWRFTPVIDNDKGNLRFK
ncbi:22606_t:CDS:1, partial [Dentiscutata erythropus]